MRITQDRRTGIDYGMKRVEVGGGIPKNLFPLFSFSTCVVFFQNRKSYYFINLILIPYSSYPCLFYSRFDYKQRPVCLRQMTVCLTDRCILVWNRFGPHSHASYTYMLINLAWSERL